MVTFAQARPGIFAGESGGDYNALYGYQNRPGGRFANTRLTDMSVGDVMQFTDPSGDYAAYVRGEVGRTATPVGAYQVVGTTLRDAVNALDIDPSTPFNQATQDRIGEWIFSTQGTGAWEGYRGPQAGGQGMQMQPQMMQPQGMQPQPMQPQGFVEQQSTDPFEGLSRRQRLMLGFGALRDAAASLQGQSTDFFGNTLGQFEQARERERLRRQGMLQALPELQRNLAMAQMMGQDTRPFESAIRSVYADLGIEQLPPSAMGGGAMAPATGGAAAVTPASAEGDTMDAEALMRQRDELRRQADREAFALGRASEVTSGQLRDIEAQIAAIPEMQAAAEEGARTAQQYDTQVSILESIINDPNLEGVTGRVEGRTDPESATGAVLFNEGEMDLLARIGQIEGSAFLQAFENLKGGGQITENEGRAATRAITRLGTRAVGTEEYKNAAEELRRVFANAAARERGQEIPFPDIREGLEGGGAEPTATEAPQPSEDGWTTFGDIRIRPVE
jgi:hypothetical protein